MPYCYYISILASSFSSIIIASNLWQESIKCVTSRSPHKVDANSISSLLQRSKPTRGVVRKSMEIPALNYVQVWPRNMSSKMEGWSELSPKENAYWETKCLHRESFKGIGCSGNRDCIDYKLDGYNFSILLFVIMYNILYKYQLA